MHFTRSAEFSVSAWSDDCQSFYCVLAAAGAIACVTILIIFFNGGISVGANNHVGIIPVVRRILDRDYLPGDFGINLRLYHHREFAYAIAAFSWLLGEDNALITLSVLNTLALASGLFCLCRSLQIPLAGYFVAGLFLALNVGWTGRGLEMNTLVGDSEANPATIAHALVLFSIAAVITRRFFIASVCAGLTLCFHLQVGAIVVILLAFFYATQLRQWSIKTSTCMTALYLVPASFPLWHLSQMARRGVFGSSFSLDYIQLRMPQHFELDSVESVLWVATHLFVQFKIYRWLGQRYRNAARGVGILFAISLVLALLSTAHFLDYYLLKTITVVKLQFIRLTPLITLFGTLSFISIVCVWLKNRDQRSLNASLLIAVYAGFVFVAGAQLLYAAGLGQTDYYSFSVRRYIDQPSSWVDICRWIDIHGSRNTKYLTPPGNEGFAYLANRSPVVEFKINPDGAQYLTEWLDRLRDLEGGALPEKRGMDYDGLLNKTFGVLTPEQFVALGTKYQAGYAVIDKSTNVPFEVVYGNSAYRLVKLPGQS